MNKHWVRWATIVFVVLFSLVPILAFAQDDGGEVGPSLGKEFLALLFSGGLTVGIVQLIRRTGIVDKVPSFTRPLIAAGIGFAAIWLTSYLGLTVDLSPIAMLFAGGGVPAFLFAVGKALPGVKLKTSK